jgi:asparagine synthase (glutamine-hydrolysing)
LYEELGDACVERLGGMFAFALWDARRERLLLARDRIGKKPLFYALRDGVLSFASELSALMQDTSIPRDVDFAALDAYFTYRYVPSPACAFHAVRKLPPAHRMTLNADGSTIERYWRLDFSRKAQGTDDELLEELREQLRSAVRRRIVADVPVGAFLSGGVDSAAIVAFMAEASSQPIKTFTIGFADSALDERELARTVAERFGTSRRRRTADAQQPPR